jgi:lysophospholipase L1-like esterase
MQRRSIIIALACLTTSLPAAAGPWTRSWYAAPDASLGAAVDLAGRTLRQVVRLSSGGDAIRLRFSNELSKAVLRVGAVHVALAGVDGAIVPGSDRIVTFAGAAAANAPAQAPLVSDVVAMRVAPLTRLSISFYLPEGATLPTTHASASATGWIVAGDQTGALELASATTMKRRVALAAVEVRGPRAGRTIVAFGDSITDGVLSTDDADRRWPDILAERLRDKAIAVANAGISGNRLLRDDTGPSALARFDRDALAVPGVSHIVVLEGINDIGVGKLVPSTAPRPEELIAVYRQMIARAHDRGIKLIIGTILPYEGAFYWSETGETTRAAVNTWIRSGGEADGVVDFDRVIADPAQPNHMAAAYDSGDHLHPGDAGYRAMAAAVDLQLFTK